MQEAPGIYQMLASYFGCRQEPFRRSPDPRHVSLSPSQALGYRRLLAHIRAGARHLLVIGEPGTGKTSLLRRLSQALAEADYAVSFFCNPVASISELTETATAGDPPPSPSSGREEGKGRVLLLDEADGLSEDILGALIRNSESDFTHRGRMHVVLAGRPTLLTKLRAVGLEAAAESPIRLAPLEKNEVGPFIRQHLKAVGCDSPQLFSEKAVQRVARYTGGVPARIQVLCSNAMMVAALENERVITETLVEQVAREQSFTDEEEPAIAGKASPITTPRFDELPEPEETVTLQTFTAASLESPPYRPRQGRRLGRRSLTLLLLMWVSMMLGASMMYLLGPYKHMDASRHLSKPLPPQRPEARQAKPGLPISPLPATTPMAPSESEAEAGRLQVPRKIRGYEDTPIPLDIRVTPQLASDLAVELHGLPPSVHLSAGRREGDRWLLPSTGLTGLTLTPPPHSDRDFSFSIQGFHRTSGQRLATASVEAKVRAVADMPQLKVSAAPGDRFTPIPLQIWSRLEDQDGSEELTIDICGVPYTVKLSAGHPQRKGCWTLTPAQLRGLILTPLANSPPELILGVTAKATESANGDSASTTETLRLQVFSANPQENEFLTDRSPAPDR
ncbi:ExeA family protein [Methylohalobius crimeensis]|uniref:ExeA family protein n=1 Tax=Methylohalobius crimeensis TaxID=244365 RepID=UPI0003B3FE2C|nr:AAA family ATPase [Methylohalobius crimeensis]